MYSVDTVFCIEYNCTQKGEIMIESLYISKSRIRQDLLGLFFTNLSQKYYLRELQRILGYSAGSIRRELLKFQKDDLFITQRTGNLLYYRINVDHPLFSELKSIVCKTVGVEARLRKALFSVPGVKIAFIYGSFASKKENAASDIDLMIIGTPSTSRINEKIAEIEKLLKREINPTIYSISEYMAKKKAKSGFISDLLKNPKIMLIGTENDL